jgi:hypothetical protein
MQSNELDLASKLKLGADILIKNNDIWKAFTKHGQIHVSGSAELDVLVYPDLDVYFDLYNCQANIDEIFAKASLNIVKLPNTVSIRFEKELYKLASHIPKGIYMQVKYRLNGCVWQIDIWWLENKEELDKQLKETAELKSKINSSPDIKKLILQVKHSIKRPDGSTPSYSGYYIYKAILDKGLKDIDSIKKYIESQNVKIT